MGDWIAYWNSDSPIYVNGRHRDVHYAAIARDISAYVPSPNAVVLDYGCGEALHADAVAASAGQLILCEAASTVRSSLTARFKENAKIDVCAPDEIATRPSQSFDLIVMHSVAQYMSGEELNTLLARFRVLLRPEGMFILGDIIPLNVSPITDALALLRFAAAHGFLIAALFGLARTFFSDYWRLRHTLGVTHYSEADILTRLKAAGFLAARAEENIGHNPARMTFLARPA